MSDLINDCVVAVSLIVLCVPVFLTGTEIGTPPPLTCSHLLHQLLQCSHPHPSTNPHLRLTLHLTPLALALSPHLPLITRPSPFMPLDHQDSTLPGFLLAPSPHLSHIHSPSHSPLSLRMISTDRGTTDRTSELLLSVVKHLLIRCSQKFDFIIKQTTKASMKTFLYFYRCIHRVTSKLDEFTKDFHKELMKYRNAPKRRRPSYSR